MRALICTAFAEPEALTVQTVPDPTPGPGEVVLDVQAAGVNYPDALMVMGQYQGNLLSPSHLVRRLLG